MHSVEDLALDADRAREDCDLAPTRELDRDLVLAGEVDRDRLTVGVAGVSEGTVPREAERVIRGGR